MNNHTPDKNNLEKKSENFSVENLLEINKIEAVEIFIKKQIMNTNIL